MLKLCYASIHRMIDLQKVGFNFVFHEKNLFDWKSVSEGCSGCLLPSDAMSFTGYAYFTGLYNSGMDWFLNVPSVLVKAKCVLVNWKVCTWKKRA
jgi:hypothetical protein